MAGRIRCAHIPYLFERGVLPRLFLHGFCYNLPLDRRNRLHAFFLLLTQPYRSRMATKNLLLWPITRTPYRHSWIITSTKSSESSAASSIPTILLQHSGCYSPMNMQPCYEEAALIELSILGLPDGIFPAEPIYFKKAIFGRGRATTAIQQKIARGSNFNISTIWAENSESV